MVNGQVLESGPPERMRASAAVRPRTWATRMRAHGALLDARGLHTYYGDSHVLHGVDFAGRAGKTVGLMGRNGMGKTHADPHRCSAYVRAARRQGR